MSAEQGVLLEFEAEYIDGFCPMRLLRDGALWALEVLKDGSWRPHVSDNALDVARGMYDAMRAREVRE